MERDVTGPQSATLPMAALGWGYLGFAFVRRALELHTPVLCPFRLLTGHPCPLCGMTHAFGAILAGNIADATQYHPFAVPAFILWLGMTVAYTVQLLCRSDMARIRRGDLLQH